MYYFGFVLIFISILLVAFYDREEEIESEPESEFKEETEELLKSETSSPRSNQTFA